MVCMVCTDQPTVTALLTLFSVLYALNIICTVTDSLKKHEIFREYPETVEPSD